jgi:hypothetical protein
MNNKGTIVTVLALLIVGTSLVVASNIDFKKVENKTAFKASWTEQTKSNFRTIWCKMQNKGAEYCDGLLK